jgi:tetratricopeptide (TPR) repeat protein
MSDVSDLSGLTLTKESNIGILRLLPRLGGESIPRPTVPATKSAILQFDAGFETGGTWAGVSQLVEMAYLGLQQIGEEAIVEAHTYELYMALPTYRDRIHPRHLCLTDAATGIERTRFYPLERAYRLVHGLVGLVLQYKRARRDQGHWTVVMRNFDQALHLGARFVAELARRATTHDAIDVFVETARDRVDVELQLPGIHAMAAAPQLVAVKADTVTRPCIDGTEAQAMEQRAEASEAVLEDKFPSLLEFYRRTGDDLSAARLALKVVSLYNRRGYYHEAKSLLPGVLPHFDQLVGSDEARRMQQVTEINSCLIASGDGDRALHFVTEFAVSRITTDHLLASANYMLAMHYLRYLGEKDIDHAERLILQAVTHVRAAESNPEARDYPFLRAFIDNGLAFLRVRQKRHQEALDLCRLAYQSVTAELGEDRHLLHRSVLQYNMGQVYVILGRLEDALDCYRQAIAMDPFYSEYLLESGNILQQLDRYGEAIDYYQRAIDCSPPYPEIYVAKAICHAQLDQWSEALACSAIGLELNPNQPDLYAARAEIFTELGDADRALSEYDQGIAVAPDLIAMRVNRAVLHFNNGAYQRALADMDDVIARDADEPAHYENRAAIYQAIDRQDLYLRDLNMAERCKEAA